MASHFFNVYILIDPEKWSMATSPVRVFEQKSNYWGLHQIKNKTEFTNFEIKNYEKISMNTALQENNYLALKKLYQTF